MGKQFSTFKFLGKVGGFVGMKGSNGNAYIRTLVTPTNPKTSAQTDQRVKMSLAGQMSKLTPQALIVGMSKDRRMRRPYFTGNIARNAVVTTIDNQRAAKINPALVLFSDGAAAQVDSSNITVSAKAASVDISMGNEVFANNIVSMIMVATFADANGRVVNIANGTVTANNLGIEIAAPAGYSRVNVYYIPVEMAEGTDNVSYQRVVNLLTQDSSYQALATIAATGSIVYRRSVYINSYTPGA